VPIWPYGFPVCTVHGQIGADFVSTPYPVGLPWGAIGPPPLLPYYIKGIYSSPDQLKNALTTGVRPDGSKFDPAMPWNCHRLVA